MRLLKGFGFEKKSSKNICRIEIILFIFAAASQTRGVKEKSFGSEVLVLWRSRRVKKNFKKVSDLIWNLD